MTTCTREQEQQPPARAEGCVLWLYGRAWADRAVLDGLPLAQPLEEWVALLDTEDWIVGWTVGAALDQEPYAGGMVVEVDADGGRFYVAVPPELLDRLQEVMAADEYAMMREDVAALANPQAHGLHVTRLDPVAWEQRHQLVPTKELPTEGWARMIRAHRQRVEIPAGMMLPFESAWPAGQLVIVTDGAGRRSYFAVPRQALRLATALSLETKGTQSLPMSPAAGIAGIGF